MESSRFVSVESDKPFSLAQLIRDNSPEVTGCDDGLDSESIAAVEALAVGEEVDIGPGGASGSFVVRRVA
jgi:hypothetical protein